jgi:hypothetical protein
MITFCCGNAIAQSNWQHFKNQPGPLKRWALLHPFKAKKAFEISLEVNKVSDSLSKLKVLDGDKVGGQIDAFRHAYWMAKLQTEIGKCAAKSLGKAYERGNYRSYKKNEKEDSILPDKKSSEMDLFNNNVGLSFSKKNDGRSVIGLQYKIINAILKGDLKVLKKDNKGNFLNCKGDLIESEQLKKWENAKCLIPSNKKPNLVGLF